MNFINMNKIEVVINQIESLINVKIKQKTILIAEINELETMLNIVEKIKNDNSIPN